MQKNSSQIVNEEVVEDIDNTAAQDVPDAQTIQTI